MSADWLHAQIQQALEHLYDYVYLQDLPLASLVGSAGEGWNRGATLHRFLVETIERLKPPSSTPVHSQLWRRYRYAFLRYVEADAVAQIVEELGISERQARRDNNQVIEAIAVLLREKLGPAASGDLWAMPAMGASPDFEPVTSVPSEGAGPRGCHAPHHPTRLVDIVTSVLTTSWNLAEAKGVAFEVQTPTTPPLVTMERTIIRQVVLTIVVGVLEIANHGDKIQVAVHADGASAKVVLTIPLTTRTHATALAGLEDRLAFATQLSKPEGGAVAEEQIRDELRITLTLPAAPYTTVLLVDDNPGMLRLLKRYLGGSGYAVLEAHTADEAITIANDYQPDIITLDVMMPSKDGWEVLQTLRAQPRTRHIPVVVCSVLKERDLAQSLGATAILSKPITQETLLRSLAGLRRHSER